MHFRLIIAADLHSYHGMCPTLGQEHTTHLRIGSLAKLITAAAKCLLIDLHISNIEERPIDGHEPIAPKEGLWSLLPLCYRLAAGLHESFHYLTPQFPSSYSQC